MKLAELHPRVVGRTDGDEWDYDARSFAIGFTTYINLMPPYRWKQGEKDTRIVCLHFGFVSLVWEIELGPKPQGLGSDG